jgi:VWFA-related protein
MFRRSAAATLVGGLLSLGVTAGQQQPLPPTAAQQRPVFRGGTHFVRVDAYPTQDGQIVEGLEAGDFEILEDGKPQKIESFDFLKFETFTPDVVRRDPQSQREGFDMAADPRYRVFVIFVDMAFSRSTGPFAEMENLPLVQQPLVNFLDRIMGRQDLYGFLTSRNSVKDLVLAQKTSVTIAQIRDLWRAAFIDKDDAELVLENCRATKEVLDAMKARYRADMTYSTLRDLVNQLGSLRQERKNIVLATNLLPRWRSDPGLLNKSSHELPRVGIVNGRVTTDDRMTPVSGNPATVCAAEFQRLAFMDFDPRFKQLLDVARRENVSFYVIAPGGLQAPPDLLSTRAMQAAYDDLESLADETDGIAVVNTNDLTSGMKRIADDLAAYYVLGYYTTNTRFDGGLRNIKVRLKADGKAVRARRQYRAPTQAEIAALAAGFSSSSTSLPAVAAPPSPREAALIVLERANRPFSVYAAAAAKQLTVVAELSAASIQAGKWKDGADVEVVASGADGNPVATVRGKIEPGSYSTSIRLPPATARPARVAVRLTSGAEPAAEDWVLLAPPSGTLVGDAVASRSASRTAMRPVAAFEFARNERIRVEWPVLSALDRREVRLLDKAGRPLPVDLPLSEDVAKSVLVVDMSLSGLGRGDYLIELTAGAGAVTEKRLIAIRIR